MKKFLALAIGTCAVITPIANAQENAEAIPKSLRGWYATVGVGGNWAADPTTTWSGSGVAGSNRWSENLTATPDLGGGVSVGAGLGYDFGNNIRGELAYNYNAISIGTTTGSGTVTVNGTSYNYNGSISTSGTANTNSVLASAYYDIPTKSRFVPYIGGGLGWTSVGIPDQSYSATGNLAGYTGTLSGLSTSGGSASAFGYQAKVGVSYLASKSSDLFVEGIYQGNTSVTINSINISAINDFGVRAGVRYRFGK